MANFDWKLIVSLYAALVSTFVAVWRIYEFIDDRKGRIKIKIINGLKGPITKFWDEFDKEMTVTALITNVGKKARYLKSPYFNVYPSMLVDAHRTITQADLKTYKGPQKIEPGEEMRYDIPMWLLVKYRKAGAKQVQIGIGDTHGKTHKSRWRSL